MSQRQLHIIDRLRIELNISKPQKANLLQEKVSNLVRDRLETDLEKLFDNLAGNETLVIDQLVIDLGLIKEEDLGQNFMERTTYEINQKLSAENRSELFFENDMLIYSKNELYFETLSHYLVTGTYPWFVSQYTDDPDLGDPHRIYQFLQAEEEQKLLDLIKKRGIHPGFRKRLIYLLNDEEFEQLIEKNKSGTISANLTPLLLILEKTGIDPGISKIGVKQIRLADSVGITSAEKLMTIFLNGFEEYDVSELLLYRLAKQSPKVKQLEGGVFLKSLKELTGLYRLKQLLDEEKLTLDYLKEELKQVPLAGEVKRYVHRIQHSNMRSKDVEVLRQQITKSIKGKIGYKLNRESEFDTQKNRKPVQEDFYVTNAGLIILWPFLPKFFRSLELIIDNRFIDVKAQTKAIHILQYLAAGKQNTFEYVMVLNKILCGYEVHKPIRSKLKFSKNDMDKADEFLESVIKQWEALKNTSPGGFRNSFLQRSARLKEFPDKWELQVETKAFDMLLDKLPWGISVIRLPWMEKPVYTNWR